MKLFRANKKLGQHFLYGRDLQKLCVEGHENAGFCLEVGPGPGSLTQHLSLPRDRLFAIEPDPQFYQHLQQWIDAERIFQQDALEFSWADFERHFPIVKVGQGHFISNLPYNVGVPILRRFLPIEHIVQYRVMMQREVVDRFFPIPGKESSLSLLVSPFFEKRKIKILPPGSFSPPPKVHSAIFELSRSTRPELEIAQLPDWERWLRWLFSSPRKQLGSLCRKTAPQRLPYLQQNQLERVRPEDLSAAQALDWFKISER